MSFEIKNVLQNAEAYRDFDFSNQKDQKETPMVSFPEISEIVTKWSNTLFSDDLATKDSFAMIKAFDNSKNLKAANTEQRVKNAAIFLHGTTWASLKENQAPNEEQLKKIQSVFQNAADSLKKASEQTAKMELTQLSLHPRLLTKCSHEFLEAVAFNHSNMDDIDYSFDKVLYDNRGIHEHNGEIADAIRLWGNYLPSESVTKDGFQAIEKGWSYPYFNTFRYTRKAQESIEDTARYFSSIALKAMKEERELSDSELKNLDTLLDSLHEHLQNIQDSYALFKPKNDAEKELQKAKETLHQHKDDSAKRKEELTEAHQDAICGLKEAEEAQKKESLKEVLATEVTTRKEIVEAAKHHLESTVKTDLEKTEELTQAVAKAQEKFDDLYQESRKAPLYEKYVTEVSQEAIDMVARMKENMKVSFLCMKDFLSFAQARADMELKKSSWFSGFRIW